MDSGLILITYILFFIAEFGFETFLTILNIRYVKEHGFNLPLQFKEHITEAKHKKSSEYTITKNRYSLISSSAAAVFLLLIIVSGTLGKISFWLEGFNLSEYFSGVLFIFIISAVFQLFSLPFSIYSQFVIEKKFGFNKMTIKIFFMDFFKSSILSILIGVPLLLGIFWFMDRTGTLWWIYASGFVIGVQFLMMFIYPVIIAPLFNKFSPLEDGELKTALLTLAKKLKFNTSGLFVMDGSKRSTHSNAYFTGFGKNKRIVLFDTLMDILSIKQLQAVLAHEIGHQKKRHIAKRMILSLFFTFAGFWIISLLAGYFPLFEAFGFNSVSYSGILVILSFCSGPFTFMLTPLFASWSRKNEYEADEFAFNISGNSEELIDGLVILYKENLANLTPHPLYSFYHYTHPALSERIKALHKLSAN